MNSRIAIVGATQMELNQLIDFLESETVQISPLHYQYHEINIDILITGPGILNTTYALMNYLMEYQPEAWIHAGIGGAFDPSLKMGNTYLISNEYLVDFGAQESDGTIINPFKLGWSDPNEFPYTNEKLECPYVLDELPSATGMTTLYSHGYEEKINALREGWHGQIENMEGAAFFYVSLMRNIPFLSIRSISNYVASRNKENWDINTAVNNLNDSIITLLKKKNMLKSLFSINNT